MNLAQGGGKVANEGAERHGQGVAAPDQDIVTAGARSGPGLFHSGAQTAPDSVAFDRVAGLLGYREAKARRIGLWAHIRKRLKHKRRTGRTRSPRDGHELDSFLQTVHETRACVGENPRAQGQVVRPTTACDHEHDGQR